MCRRSCPSPQWRPSRPSAPPLWRRRTRRARSLLSLYRTLSSLPRRQLPFYLYLPFVLATVREPDRYGAVVEKPGDLIRPFYYRNPLAVNKFLQPRAVELVRVCYPVEVYVVEGEPAALVDIY